MKKFKVTFLPDRNNHSEKIVIDAETVHQAKCGNVVFKTDGKIVAVIDRSEFKYIKEDV